MKTVVLISFDLISPDEPGVSLSVGMLLASARSHPSYGRRFTVAHASFNMAECAEIAPDVVLERVQRIHQFETIDAIVLSAYIWCDYIINPLIQLFRKEGFRGRIMLGGYQISYSDNEFHEYPDCQAFLRGYAEASLVEAVLAEGGKLPRVYSTEPSFSTLPSPYLTGEIEVLEGQRKVRLETKRGCPYACSFCAHRDLQRHKVYRRNIGKVADELGFLDAKRVAKINVVDPVFNSGHDYLELLEWWVARGSQTRLALQVRFENIRGNSGDRFLALCQAGGCHLEFGLQSAIPEECLAINRKNDISQIERVLEQLGRMGISFEVSLIYGLPLQTVDSFRRSIEFLKERGCKRISAFPLMLLKGTPLFQERVRWEFKEECVGSYRIPVVVQSSTLDRQAWTELASIAESLDRTSRV